MEKQPILVVDDEKNIRLTISQSLEPLDLPIWTAASGKEALQKLQESPIRACVFRYENAWDGRDGSVAPN